MGKKIFVWSRAPFFFFLGKQKRLLAHFEITTQAPPPPPRKRERERERISQSVTIIMSTSSFSLAQSSSKTCSSFSTARTTFQNRLCRHHRSGKRSSASRGVARSDGTAVASSAASASATEKPEPELKSEVRVCGRLFVFFFRSFTPRVFSRALCACISFPLSRDMDKLERSRSLVH